MKIPTFVDVLDKTKAWRDSNTPEALEEARKLLEAGVAEYDDALPLGDELVLVFKGQGKLDEAIEWLVRLEQRFKHIGEETLCRWGGIYKLRAKQKMEKGSPGAAELDYRESERYYARAYEEYHTFYPRINELTMHFVRAGLAKELRREKEAAILLRDVHARAEAMLDDPIVWEQRKRDDAVWTAASRGEACLLLGRWVDASANYSEAILAANGKKFYHDCMRDQIRDELIPAFARLSLVIEGPLADPENFFAL